MSREKPAAEATAPFKEAIEMIREAGGEAFRNCFQCGLCTASCPGTTCGTFTPHRKITESKFGWCSPARKTGGSARPATRA